MRCIVVLGSILVSIAAVVHAEPVGHFYSLSEHGVIPKERLQTIANRVEKNFHSIDIEHSTVKVVDSFPQLQPLDALVIYLDTDMAPKDVGPGRDDCPLSDYDVGESDILNKQSYDQMKERLGFDYDVETVQGSVVYICPGRLLFLYKLQRMLADKEDEPLTDKDIDSILASAATHEIAHTLGAVHVFKIGDPLYIPAEGDFLGSVITYASDSTKFHEGNVEKIKDFIGYAKSLKNKIDMPTLNSKKTYLLYDFIIQSK